MTCGLCAISLLDIHSRRPINLTIVTNIYPSSHQEILLRTQTPCSLLKESMQYCPGALYFDTKINSALNDTQTQQLHLHLIRLLLSLRLLGQTLTSTPSLGYEDTLRML